MPAEKFSWWVAQIKPYGKGSGKLHVFKASGLRTEKQIKLDKEFREFFHFDALIPLNDRTVQTLHNTRQAALETFKANVTDSISDLHEEIEELKKQIEDADKLLKEGK